MTANTSPLDVDHEVILQVRFTSPLPSFSSNLNGAFTLRNRLRSRILSPTSTRSLQLVPRRQKPPLERFPPFRTLRLPPPQPPPSLNPFQTRRRSLFRAMATTNGRRSTSRTWPSGNTRTPCNERRRRRSEANGSPRGRPSVPPPPLASALGRTNPSWVNILPRFSAVLQVSLELDGRKSVRPTVRPSSPLIPPQCVFFLSDLYPAFSLGP